MKQCQTRKIFSLTAVVVLTGVLSACTSTGSTVDESGPTAGAGDSSAASGVSKAGVFSSLKELNYTPTGEGAYKIAPNDLIEINVFRVDELSGKTRVDQNGRISLPLIGVMPVAGLTQEQLEKKLAQKLSQTYLQNPQVSVFVQEQTSKEVTVGGAVKKAGVFPLKTSTTLSQAIAMAGGPTDLADPSKLVLFRPMSNGQFKAYNLDLKSIREGKMRDPYISGKDQVILHESGSRVWLGRVMSVTRGIISPFSL